ncbi:hypothetical protein, partial [Mesorhizobium sp.]|uniref:hypothetical protein n=1 Tax=Mesorhizobium sp. TaxID=1871066 RepID=UPI002579E578
RYGDLRIGSKSSARAFKLGNDGWFSQSRSFRSLCPFRSSTSYTFFTGASLCGDPLDRMPGLAGFVAPVLQQLQQRWCVGIDLFLRGWRSRPGTSAAISHFALLISMTVTCYSVRER